MCCSVAEEEGQQQLLRGGWASSPTSTPNVRGRLPIFHPLMVNVEAGTPDAKRNLAEVTLLRRVFPFTIHIADPASFLLTLVFMNMDKSVPTVVLQA